MERIKFEAIAPTPEVPGIRIAVQRSTPAIRSLRIDRGIEIISFENLLEQLI